MAIPTDKELFLAEVEELAATYPDLQIMVMAATEQPNGLWSIAVGGNMCFVCAVGALNARMAMLNIKHEHPETEH
jgi:hypothetical protein